MRALDFWKTVTVDRSDLLDRFTTWLHDSGAAYCVIGGQAVNAYVDPLVSLDLDVVVAGRDPAHLENQIAAHFLVERFPHSLNVSDPASDLRIQVQLDPRYAPFAVRAEQREVLGMILPVAHVEDVLQGKVWAASDPARRASKRQKDLADIARLIEAYPALRTLVPADVLRRLVD